MNEFKNHNGIDVRLALADKHKAIARDKKFSYIASEFKCNICALIAGIGLFFLLNDDVTAMVVIIAVLGFVGTVSLCVASTLTWSEYEKHRDTARDVLTVPEDEARVLSEKAMKK
jgi:hypothetical protein